MLGLTLRDHRTDDPSTTPASEPPLSLGDQAGRISDP